MSINGMIHDSYEWGYSIEGISPQPMTRENTHDIKKIGFEIFNSFPTLFRTNLWEMDTSAPDKITRPSSEYPNYGAFCIEAVQPKRKTLLIQVLFACCAKLEKQSVMVPFQIPELKPDYSIEQRLSQSAAQAANP